MARVLHERADRGDVDVSAGLAAGKQPAGSVGVGLIRQIGIKGGPGGLAQWDDPVLAALAEVDPDSKVAQVHVLNGQVT